ncbi:hypothetical protein D3C78_1765340 [compost metagenome]
MPGAISFSTSSTVRLTTTRAGVLRVIGAGTAGGATNSCTITGNAASAAKTALAEANAQAHEAATSTCFARV